MPPKNDSGTLMTSAHGHDTTRKVSPRSIQSRPALPEQQRRDDGKQHGDAH